MCAIHWHRTGTLLGRLPRPASGVLTWTHSPLDFLEISHSSFVFSPLLFHLVRPCRRELWDGLQGASLGFPLATTLSLVLDHSQNPDPAAPAFTHTHPLVPVPKCPLLCLILPSGNGPLLLVLPSKVPSFRDSWVCDHHHLAFLWIILSVLHCYIIRLQILGR